jgi:hypothetical protein
MWLAEKDRKYLNDIYAKAYKKYFGWTASTPGGKPLSYQEAVVVARDELERFHGLRCTEIHAKHDARVLAINTEANKRGLITSTVVLQQIERAMYERDLALEKFGTVTDAKVRAAARKIMAEELANTKLRVQADRDALNMITQRARTGGIPQSDLQRAMDEEVYAEYLRFLLGLSPEVALAHVDNDPLFFFNLSSTYFNRLKAEMERRGWRT